MDPYSSSSRHIPSRTCAQQPARSYSDAQQPARSRVSAAHGNATRGFDNHTPHQPMPLHARRIVPVASPRHPETSLPITRPIPMPHRLPTVVRGVFDGRVPLPMPLNRESSPHVVITVNGQVIVDTKPPMPHPLPRPSRVLETER